MDRNVKTLKSFGRIREKESNRSVWELNGCKNWVCQNVCVILIAVSKDLVGDQGVADGGKYAHVALKEIDISKSFLVECIPMFLLYIYIVERKSTK